jgi:signal peptidase II
MSTPIAPPLPPRRRAVIIAIGLALAAVALVADRVTKDLALQHLSETERIPLLGDWFGLQLAFNTGASFSLGSEMTLLISIVGILAVIAVTVAIIRTRSRLWAAGLGLVLGGAVGNLIDRFVAEPGGGRGAVTDMLAYGNLFIGNVADFVIGVGVGLIIIAVIRAPASKRGAAAEDAALEGDATAAAAEVDRGEA